MSSTPQSTPEVPPQDTQPILPDEALLSQNTSEIISPGYAGNSVYIKEMSSDEFQTPSRDKENRNPQPKPGPSRL